MPPDRMSGPWAYRGWRACPWAGCLSGGPWPCCAWCWRAYPVAGGLCCGQGAYLVAVRLPLSRWPCLVKWLPVLTWPCCGPPPDRHGRACWVHTFATRSNTRPVGGAVGWVPTWWPVALAIPKASPQDQTPGLVLPCLVCWRAHPWPVACLGCVGCPCATRSNTRPVGVLGAWCWCPWAGRCWCPGDSPTAHPIQLPKAIMKAWHAPCNPHKPCLIDRIYFEARQVARYDHTRAETLPASPP